jgi:hypothetical protein
MSIERLHSMPPPEPSIDPGNGLRLVSSFYDSSGERTGDSSAIIEVAKAEVLSRERFCSNFCMSRQ